MVRFRNLLLVWASLVFLQNPGFSQYTTTLCQTVTDALIGPDRNDWAHANLPIVNEGYLHNFWPPHSSLRHQRSKHYFAGNRN